MVVGWICAIWERRRLAERAGCHTGRKHGNNALEHDLCLVLACGRSHLLFFKKNPTKKNATKKGDRAYVHFLFLRI